MKRVSGDPRRYPLPPAPGLKRKLAPRPAANPPPRKLATSPGSPVPPPVRGSGAHLAPSLTDPRLHALAEEIEAIVLDACCPYHGIAANALALMRLVGGAEGERLDSDQLARCVAVADAVSDLYHRCDIDATDSLLVAGFLLRRTAEALLGVPESDCSQLPPAA